MSTPATAPTRGYDLTRTFLTILIIAALISGSLWTLLAFLSALLWATTLVIATWPMLLQLQGRLGGRRGPAAALMVILLVALFIVPFGMAVTTLIDSAVQGVELVRGVAEQGLRPLPDWLVTIPWAGPRIDARWRELAALPPEGLADMLRPFLLSAAGWAVTLTGGIGRVAIHFLLTVLLAAILYTNGEAAAAGVVAFARRIGADRAERTVRLAAQATRGVALGVVVTAVVQTAIAGAGLWLVGAPRAGLLTAVLFVLCIAQLGPLLVMIPVIAWLFWTGSIGWGIVLVVVAVIVAIVDNVLKPVLIRRGVDLPLLLIVAGVIGGLIGFGVMGLFIGPVVLAVTYTLLGDWIREGEPAQS